MSKGSKRRPTLVSMDKVDANWDKIFKEESGRVSFSEQTLKVLNWDDDFETSVGALYPGSRQETKKPKEIGGRKGLDPTRYNDWEKDGKCVDF